MSSGRPPACPKMGVCQSDAMSGKVPCQVHINSSFQVYAKLVAAKVMSDCTTQTEFSDDNIAKIPKGRPMSQIHFMYVSVMQLPLF